VGLGFGRGGGESGIDVCRDRQTAGPSTPPLAIKLREAPLRMTVNIRRIEN
jgi:hypothetical protein